MYYQKITVNYAQANKGLYNQKPFTNNFQHTPAAAEFFSHNYEKQQRKKTEINEKQQ